MTRGRAHHSPHLALEQAQGEGLDDLVFHAHPSAGRGRELRAFARPSDAAVAVSDNGTKQLGKHVERTLHLEEKGFQFADERERFFAVRRPSPVQLFGDGSLINLQAFVVREVILSRRELVHDAHRVRHERSMLLLENVLGVQIACLETYPASDLFIAPQLNHDQIADVRHWAD